MKHKLTLSPAKLLALGFLGIILLGTSLLCLPFASYEGHTSFVDALFTATSATCVTGLVTLTTATHWTLFGKIVIILLIQIGGLGFMTFVSLSAIILNKNISLHERKLMVQSTGSLELRGIINLIKRVALGTMLVEGAGAILLMLRFLSLGNGFLNSLWYGIFHSISAFCNAGFDIIGDNSLINYSSDPFILITISLLIIIGGIGFLVWNDFVSYKFNFKKYKLHSKLALLITSILIFGGWILLYITERNASLGSFSEGDKWLNAFFQSVTLRTAGFDSISQGSLSRGGSVISVVFMLIGGCPGSTAGGIKAITFLVVILNTISFARDKDSITIFKKRISDSTVKQSCAIMTLYLLAVCAVTVAICLIEGDSFSLGNIIYEVASAIATVGLTQGITPLLSVASKIILCFAMYFGRLGGLTLLLAIAEKQPGASLERPYEKILIG